MDGTETPKIVLITSYILNEKLEGGEDRLFARNSLKFYIQIAIINHLFYVRAILLGANGNKPEAKPTISILDKM